MGMLDWAKREVEIACKRENPDLKEDEWDYGCECYKSALKAYESLCEDGHSGMSFSLTKNILIRLMNGLPLTPIEDNDEEWGMSYHDEDGSAFYQSRRMPSLFKHVNSDGSIRYSANNYYCIDEVSGLPYYGGGASNILNEYVEPIAMPYWPPEKKYEIHTKEYLTDRANGDFDTKAYLYIICPDGKRININRYFGEIDGAWKEIDKKEYKLRVRQHNARVRKEKTK